MGSGLSYTGAADRLARKLASDIDRECLVSFVAVVLMKRSVVHTTR